MAKKNKTKGNQKNPSAYKDTAKQDDVTVGVPVPDQPTSKLIGKNFLNRIL